MHWVLSYSAILNILIFILSVNIALHEIRILFLTIIEVKKLTII